MERRAVREEEREGEVTAPAAAPAPAPPATVKPAYRLPSMAEVAAARGTNGLTVVSSFSGCGGSCLGFEQAGYRVLWANEFVEAARDTYAANHPDTILDGRDIRQVQAAEILEATGLAVGELDVFNGSPPCASFSTAGRREKNWGEVKSYSDTKQRTDDLFFEFVRLVDGLQPRAFVAENVAGLTRGTAIGTFKIIMRELVACGYSVRCKILDAQWLGVPQTRQRAILIGVRNDLDFEPEYPKPLPYRYTLREVLPWLVKARYNATGGFGELSELDRPSVAILATGGFGELSELDRPSVAILASEPHKHAVHGPEWLAEGGKAVLAAWRQVDPGEASEKYFSLKRNHLDEPSRTILARQGIASSIACVTVPNEPRRFTIPELRIVCGFPSDFVLTGSYAQQWERLGRAVPPPMMRSIAATLRDGLFTKLGRTRAAFTEAA